MMLPDRAVCPGRGMAQLSDSNKRCVPTGLARIDALVADTVTMDSTPVLLRIELLKARVITGNEALRVLDRRPLSVHQGETPAPPGDGERCKEGSIRR